MGASSLFAASLLCVLSAAAVADDAALRAAIEARDHEKLATLIRAGNKPAPITADTSLMTLAESPLAVAISNRDQRAAQLLLKSGIDTESLRRLAALIDRDRDMLKLFVEHGLDANAEVMGLSLAASAVIDGDVATLDMLVASGAALDRRDVEGNGLLHLAQRADKRKRKAMVAWLLARRARHDSLQPDSRNKAGETPLHLALEDAEADSLKLLLDAGARMAVANHAGITPRAYLWASSRNRELQQRYPVSELSASEREFAVGRLLAGADSCAVLPQLVTPAEVRAHDDWLIRAVRGNSAACLHHLLALGGNANVADYGVPLWLSQTGDRGEGPKLVARQLIAAGASLDAHPQADISAFSDYLADPAHRDWWRRAGLRANRPLAGPGSDTADAWLRREAPTPRADWQTAPAPALRASYGPALAGQTALLAGVWKEADGDSQWSFTTDGGFTAKLKVLFVEKALRGRWQFTATGIQLEGEAGSGFQRLLLPLLWVGDEITFDDPLEPKRYQRISTAPADLAGPALASLSPAQACAGAAQRLADAGEGLEMFQAAARQKAEAGARERADAAFARLRDVDGFAVACEREYTSDARMRQFAQCLHEVTGVVGVLGCAGLAADAGRAAEK